ncbi:MAG: rhamnulokinase [Oscillospiraceae bacterium]|nr:rhamnulokinase [Oscillospiraceae bacterium]
MSRRVLALDLSAAGGRIITAIYDGNRLRMQDVHRFPNEPVSCGGHVYWDILRIFQEIKAGLRKAHAMGGFDSIGINAWEKDYGLLDKRGNLLSNPFHFSDKRTERILRSDRDLLQILKSSDCTAVQLFEQKCNAPELLAQAQVFLPIPDLIAYFLTGDISTEHCIADATGMFDHSGGGWNSEIVEQLGIPEHLFPTIMQTGTRKGMLSEEICTELDIPSVPVIAVCGNGSQCAAVSVPDTDGIPFASITCGASSRFTFELDEDNAALSSDQHAFVPQAGFGTLHTLQKDMNGLRMIQDIRRALLRRGRSYSYSELEKLAAQAEPAVRFIDTDAPAFSESYDILTRLRAWCIESGQQEPSDLAEALRCIYESLACKFRDTLDEMQRCTGKKISRIYMLGGSRDMLLCQLTADICNIPVLIGPAEAAAYGNAVIQLISEGELDGISQARRLIADSITIKEYIPNPQNAFIYENYSRIFHS